MSPVVSPLLPRKARRGAWVPLQRRRVVPVVYLDKRQEVGVVAVLVLY
jgi:hypothetical protein